MKDKDRELRRVVHELTTQIIGELVGYFKDEEGFVIKLEDDAISQIKALVIESLGKESKESKGNGGEFDDGYDTGYNQHIAEMKEKWKS